MKVYAHYLKDGDVEYRWKTLLQFGKNWDIIGSVVMKNPGSAAPKAEVIEEKTLFELNKFDAQQKWYEFTIDNTMQCVENLFREYQKYHNDNFELNGVVQIFNLFNIREADLDKALKIAQNVGGEVFYQTTNDDLASLKAPVYLGWGGLGSDERFFNQAKKYFEQVELLDQGYLHNSFEDNIFYHPQYLIGRGKNKPKSVYLKSCFFQNTTQPEGIEHINFNVKFDKEIVFNRVVEEIGQANEKHETNEKTVRFLFPDNKDLQLTITKSEKGYVGIRHTNFEGAKKYGKDIYPNEKKMIGILEEYEYPHSDVWLGTKNFNAYGFSDEEIVKSIIEEIKELQTKLSSIK